MTIAPAGRTATSLAQRVATEIRAEMGRQNRTMNGLARDLGATQPWLWRRLRGNQPMTLDEVEQICRVLGVPAEEIIARAVVLVRSTRLLTDGYVKSSGEATVSSPIRLRPASYPAEFSGPPDRKRRPVRLAA